MQNGITTDSVSLSYIPHGDTFHPIATIRTGDGVEMVSSDDPTRKDIVLPSRRVIQVGRTSDDFWAEVLKQATPEDWRIAERETFDRYVEEYGETDGRAMFIQEYGSYPIADDVPYDTESRPFDVSSYVGTSLLELNSWQPSFTNNLADGFVSEDVYLQHPRTNRTIRRSELTDILDDSTKEPNHYTFMGAFGYTDYPSATAAGDNDHLSWGIWYHYTITPSALENFSFGTFADGVETPASNIPLSGTASYSGYTSGRALKGGTPTRDNLDDDAYWASRLFDFLGAVNLSVDFAEASVRGRVNNFQAELPEGPADLSALNDVLGENGFLRNLSIDLEDASIAAGTFTGDARATGLGRGRREMGRSVLRHAGQHGRGAAGRRRHLGRYAGHGRQRLEDARRVRQLEAVTATGFNQEAGVSRGHLPFPSGIHLARRSFQHIAASTRRPSVNRR